jgi:hypothetical protein
MQGTFNVRYWITCTKYDLNLLHQNVTIYFKNKHIEQCEN